MSACPICGNSIAGLICTSCGFDGSCNYEEYPTLADTISSEAVSQLKKSTAKRAVIQHAM